MVAGQRIGVGIGHAGQTVTVEGDRFHVHNDERLLVEVARTTAKPVARFKARKPEPSPNKVVGMMGRRQTARSTQMQFGKLGRPIRWG